VAVYERMLALRPDDAEAFLNMLWARKYACDWGNWEHNLGQLRAMVEQQLQQGKPPSLKPFLALAFPIGGALYLEIAAAHAREEAKKAVAIARVQGELSHAHLRDLLQPRARALSGSSVSLSGSAGARVRLAYASTDLGDHPVGHQAWFHHHNAQVAVFVLLC